MKQERRSPQAGSSNPFAEELRQTNDWGKAGEGGGKKEVKEKEKVNLGLSGALTADQNTYKVSKTILSLVSHLVSLSKSSFRVLLSNTPNLLKQRFQRKNGDFIRSKAKNYSR